MFILFALTAATLVSSFGILLGQGERFQLRSRPSGGSLPYLWGVVTYDLVRGLRKLRGYWPLSHAFDVCWPLSSFCFRPSAIFNTCISSYIRNHFVNDVSTFLSRKIYQTAIKLFWIWFLMTFKHNWAFPRNVLSPIFKIYVMTAFLVVDTLDQINNTQILDSIAFRRFKRVEGISRHYQHFKTILRPLFSRLIFQCSLFFFLCG